MALTWHTSAQTLTALLLFVLACEEKLADQGAKQSDSSLPDRSLQTTPYELCDGSDQIRLALKSEGGHVDTGYFFTHPHGHRFLYVDGKCRFVAQPLLSGGDGWVEGTLSAEQGRTLRDTLQLSAFSGFTFVDQGTCADGGIFSIATQDAYGDIGCNGRDDAPAPLQKALAGIEAAFALATSAGAHAAGAVELFTRSDWPQYHKTPDGLLAWPYSWPASEVAYSSSELSEDGGSTVAARVLQGQDALAARTLREQAKMQRHGLGSALVLDRGRTYSVFIRDQIAPAFEQAVRAFEAEHNPWQPKALLACGDRARADDVTFSDAEIRGSLLHVSREPASGCFPRLCWDEGFKESHPVQTSVRVVKGAAPRACKGAAHAYARFDLRPITEAFQRGYPGAPVEVQVGLSGFTKEQLTLYDRAAENVACASRSVATCSEDARCRVVLGRPIDRERACRLPEVAAACGAHYPPCAGPLAFEAPDEQQWVLSNTCAPPHGFQPLHSESEPRPEQFAACTP